MRPNSLSKFDQEVPQFVEAWKKVAEQGFFTFFDVSIRTFEEDDFFFSYELRFTGYIPKLVKYKIKGIYPYINILNVLEMMRGQLENRKLKLKQITCKINSEDWKLFNKNGTKIIGNKGYCITASLFINIGK